MRVAGHHVPPARVALFLSESVIVLIAACAGALWSGATTRQTLTGLVAATCGVAVMIALYLADLYDTRIASADVPEGRRLLGGLGAIVLAAAPVALITPGPTRTAIPFALAAAGLGAAGLRALSPWRLASRRVIVVGEGDALLSLLDELAEQDGGDDVVATLDVHVPDLLARAVDLDADTIVFAKSDRRGQVPEGLLACRLAGIEVLEAPAYIEQSRRKIAVDLIRPAALIYGEGFHRTRAGDVGRRALSLTGALAIAVLTAPVMALVALAVKLDSHGPVFYRQTRVGRAGRTFRICKFRTMTADAEAKSGAVWAKVGDPRVTRVGAFLRKTRLDELPQLANVLWGDMELVGPRPERPEFVAELSKEIPFYEVRSLVRPGLTGWAQIRYRYGASIEETRHKLGFDLYYVKHASPLLDAIVLFHTAKTVLLGRGAR
jgi:exopolysaccharide biosynthesis polyprenyl glycosylphosphotransferase